MTQPKHGALIAIRDKKAKGPLSRLSSDLSELHAWVDEKGGKAKPDKAKSPAVETKSPDPSQATISDDIQQIAENFQKAMAAFRAVSSYSRNMGALLPRIVFDDEIREYSQKKGVHIERRGSYDIYGISSGDTHELYRSIQRLHEMDNGFDQLPAALLLGLVAYYDSFVKDLLKRLMKENPERFRNSDRKITLSDLLALHSFDEMIDKVIDDDLSDMLRGSHDEHADYIKRQFGYDLSAGFKNWSTYLEIFERRNLVAHNNLVVDKQYNRNRKRHGGETYALGTRLDVDNEYLFKSVNLLVDAGSRLLFQLWRKYSGSNEGPVYDFMVEFGYELIILRAYEPAIGFMSYVLDESSPKNPEKARRMMAVNLANACKLNNDSEGMESALGRFQWDSVSDEFQICVAAIRDDIDGVVSRMCKVTSDEEVGKAGFRTWPVFKNIRADKLFISEFERIFGEALISTETGSESTEPKSSRTARPPLRRPKPDSRTKH